MTDSEKLIYFDVIKKFGLLTNTGLSPCESEGMPFRIHVALQGHGRTTCYGATLEDVCKSALEWLESHDTDWNQDTTVTHPVFA